MQYARCPICGHFTDDGAALWWRDGDSSIIRRLICPLCADGYAEEHRRLAFEVEARDKQEAS